VAVTFDTLGHRDRDAWLQLCAQAAWSALLDYWTANFLRDATCHRLVRHYRQLQGKFEHVLRARAL
jgi:hypothetical protein